MADGLNKVMLLGNLGADPELRTTQQGTAILKLRIATTESYLDKNNVRQERTEWHQCTLWGKRGEALSKFLKKGDRIFVEGSLRTTSYEKNGEKRYSTEVNVLNVILAGGGKREGGEERQSSAKPTTPQQRSTPARSPRDSDAFDAAFDGAGDDDEIPF